MVVQDVHVRVQRELAMLDQPMSTVGDVAMGLEVTFLNSAVDSVGMPFYMPSQYCKQAWSHLPAAPVQ